MNSTPTLIPSFFQQLCPLVGRLLIAALFIPAGYNKIAGFEGVSGYMAAKGLPMADVLLVLTIVIELGGGIMILLGWRAAEAALTIALFLIPVTVVFHGFWAFDDPQLAAAEQRVFMKNIAIIGGLLVIAGLGSGPLSVGRKPAGEPGAGKPVS
ncbi:MAG TPA: DoxX family protein [Porticoccaceae bacterium]|nr:DoxX family protein [Porticoccaceae bacterium]